MAGILDVLAATFAANQIKESGRKAKKSTKNQDPNEGLMGIGEAEMGPMMEALNPQPAFTRTADGGMRINVNGVGSVPQAPAVAPVAPAPAAPAPSTAGNFFYPADSRREMEMAEQDAMMPSAQPTIQQIMADQQQVARNKQADKGFFGPEAEGILNNLGFATDNFGARLVRGLGAAGSDDPLGTLAKMKQQEEEFRKARSDSSKPKITPIQNGAFTLVQYPDGRTEIVRNDEVAKFMEDNSQAKFLQGLIKAQVTAQAGVDAAAKREASKEQIKTAGDTASTNLNVQELTRIQGALANTDTASGPIIGNLPKFLRDTFFPEGTSLQDSAERIIQSSLRQTLGAQFTAVEGANFLARAYNPRVSEAENARRLGVIIDELKVIQNNKDAALEYMRKNGTLDGFASGVSGAPAAGAPANPSAPAAPAAPGSVLPKSGKYF